MNSRPEDNLDRPLEASGATQSVSRQFLAGKRRFLRLATMRSRIMRGDSYELTYLAGGILDPALPTSGLTFCSDTHATAAIAYNSVIKAKAVKLL
jgi:hypothetical protein